LQAEALKMPNPSQLLLLADHLKLSLLERQRAASLHIEPQPSDEEVQHSLTSLLNGIVAMEADPLSKYAVKESSNMYLLMSSR